MAPEELDACCERLLSPFAACAECVAVSAVARLVHTCDVALGKKDLAVSVFERLDRNPWLRVDATNLKSGKLYTATLGQDELATTLGVDVASDSAEQVAELLCLNLSTVASSVVVKRRCAIVFRGERLLGKKSLALRVAAHHDKAAGPWLVVTGTSLKSGKVYNAEFTAEELSAVLGIGPETPGVEAAEVLLNNARTCASSIVIAAK